MNGWMNRQVDTHKTCRFWSTKKKQCIAFMCIQHIDYRINALLHEITRAITLNAIITVIRTENIF